MNGLPLSLALLLISTTTFATEEDADPCHIEGGGVMAGYACVAQRYKVADDQLNAEYKKAIQRTEDEQTALRKHWPNTELVSLLRSTQWAWLKSSGMPSVNSRGCPLHLHRGRAFRSKSASCK
ncbi:lysozyme inhibitor LprI family protein [Ectopseudomonas hydrolytica]|uniref:Lysozyme inhibitor LprI-like N-terminal domain-containing protein n=1 Tax=Ectopseudomonas mendocina (strain ymp) TaxID=399739 RepID=A4XZU9_ECTM1